MARRKFTNESHFGNSNICPDKRKSNMIPWEVNILYNFGNPIRRKPFFKQFKQWNECYKGTYRNFFCFLLHDQQDSSFFFTSSINIKCSEKLEQSTEKTQFFKIWSWLSLLRWSMESLLCKLSVKKLAQAIHAIALFDGLLLCFYLRLITSVVK